MKVAWDNTRLVSLRQDGARAERAPLTLKNLRGEFEIGARHGISLEIVATLTLWQRVISVNSSPLARRASAS
jgi:hypothetical protein